MAAISSRPQCVKSWMCDYITCFCVSVITCPLMILTCMAYWSVWLDNRKSCFYCCHCPRHRGCFSWQCYSSTWYITIFHRPLDQHIESETKCPTFSRWHWRDWPWIPPWIESISNEINITFRLHQQSIVTSSSKRKPGECHTEMILVLSSFMNSLCLARNKIMPVLSQRTVYPPVCVLFWCLFSALLRSLWNKHKKYPSREHMHSSHLSTYTILYITWSRNAANPDIHDV